MSSNSVRNTIIACDSLGIHYDVSRTGPSGGIVCVQRWDSSTDTSTAVAEFEFRTFSKSQIKLGDAALREDRWSNMVDILMKEGNMLSANRTFFGKGGEKYKWRSGLKKLVVCGELII